MNKTRKNFATRMAVLALCLLVLASTLSSCGYFAERFLAEYDGGYCGPDDFLYDDESTHRVVETTRRGALNTEPERETNRNETTTRPPVTTKPETTTRPVITTKPVTTVPETTDNIPDEFEDHVYLADKDKGRCPSLLGDVLVTVIFINDSESSWSSTSTKELKEVLYAQEKNIESAAASYGKELDMTFSFITVSYSGTIKSGDDASTWQNTVCKSAGFSSVNAAQKELDASNDADSNPIVFALNKLGRSYALCPTSKNNSERITLFSIETTTFTHEFCHVYGAPDYYYPKSVKELAEKQLPESIMNSGAEFDALTAFLIGWDDELDDNAYDFLESTAHLTREYLNEENSKQQTTGQVTNFELANNKGTYTGYLEFGVPEGYGKIVYDEGGSYEGYFTYGSYNGEGTRIWKDGSSYSGGWNMGKQHGKGKSTWANGDKYSGDFINGERTGKGTYTWADGASYTGDFINGERSGNGKMTWTDGTKYEGGFVNNKFEGKGTYIASNGTKYVGAFKAGKYHGYGEINYSNGASYKGYFANGNQEGNGTMIYNGGTSYTGSWKAGYWNGKGKYTYASGAYYEGDFLNHKFHGQGTYATPDGYKYVGAWENDARTGYGVAIWASGASYEGYWLNNKRHGYGKYINKNGTVFEGQWENDQFQS